MVILGPSGSGKTTALRMIAGLEPLDSGEIRIGGRQVNALQPKDRDIAMVFQNYALFAHMTVAENIGFGLRMAKSPEDEVKRRVLEVAELLGLERWLTAKPRHLSGGMQQRVALARLLMVGVDVLLLDEPFAAVDQLTRERLNIELLRVHERTSATALLVTHNISEAILLADRVIVMTPRPGRIADVIDVPFDRPRAPEMVADREFQELVLRAYRGLQLPVTGEEVHTDEPEQRKVGLPDA
jgi:NitT/TauT family transport system ATP-binding protein